MILLRILYTNEIFLVLSDLKETTGSFKNKTQNNFYP
jgi:hypothetical protein